MDPIFEPTHTAALTALRDFVPCAGRSYAKLRNYDLGEKGHPHVSKLSPYIRHRMITEEEVLEAVLNRHSLSAAEKFVQEVCWRTYWKGWLEMRPSVWSAYLKGVQHGLNRVAAEAGLRQGWEDACAGATGIAPFDYWAQELVRTGYMHNHARMWFASIWCFTLRLPWELGADFFLRHLLDGDPASNTLGWRWVAGLQTQGKVYVARSSNITKYTEGRFEGVHGLAQDAAPLEGNPAPRPTRAPIGEDWTPDAKTGLLLTEEDLSPGWLLNGGLAPASTAVLLSTKRRSPLEVAAPVAAFTEAAAEDAVARFQARLGERGPITDAPSEILAWAQRNSLTQIVVPHPAVGPAADALARLQRDFSSHGVTQVRALRSWDAEAWPHATHGFFRFKAHIPELVAHLGQSRAA